MDIGDGWTETVEVQWGVQWGPGNPARHEGTIEWFGTRPGGELGKFTLEDALYIARHSGGTGTLVRRNIVRRERVGDWIEMTGGQG